MESVLSNWAANQALALLLSGTNYLACHLTDPTDLGDVATEVAGGAYVRQPITGTSPAGKTWVGTNAQLFPGMPAVLVRYLAVWTQVSGGMLIFRQELGHIDVGTGLWVATPIDVPESGQLLCAAGDVALSL